MTTRTCRVCGTMAGELEECAGCLDAFHARRDPATMTADERVAEMNRLKGPTGIFLTRIMQRFGELVGREVFHHEVTLNYDGLTEEARVRSGVPPSADEILELIPGSKRIVVHA